MGRTQCLNRSSFITWLSLSWRNAPSHGNIHTYTESVQGSNDQQWKLAGYIHTHTHTHNRAHVRTHAHLHCRRPQWHSRADEETTILLRFASRTFASKACTHTHSPGSCFLLQTPLNVQHVLPSRYVHQVDGHSDVPKQLLNPSAKGAVRLQKHYHLVLTNGTVYKV